MAWTGYSEQGAGSQERGPGRFALQVPGAPQRRAMPTPDAVQGGIKGGQITGGLSVGRNDLNISSPGPSPELRPDPTFTALLKMGSEFFAEKVKDLEQRKFIEGMTKAASGQALLEIVNERPAWARIFGDGGAAEGARAYASEAAVSQWASSVQERMGELRKHSPDQIPQLLQDMGKQVLTGDAAADADIQMAMLKQIPQLVKAHTREHVEWQQEEASAKQAQAFVEAGRRADGILRNPKADEQERALALRNLVSSLGYAPGMNPETWTKNLAGFVKSAAQNNQFTMLKGLEETGLIATLPPDTAATLTSYVREQATRFKRDSAPSSLVFEGNIIMAQMESGVIGAEDGLKKMADINQRYRQESGNIVDLFDQNVLGASLQTAAKGAYAAREAEHARVQRERADAAEKGNKAQYELGRQKDGELAAAVGQARHIVGTNREHQDWVAGAWRSAAGTPQGYFSLIENWRDGGIVSDAVQLDMQRDWKAVRPEAGPGPNFVTAYTKWRDFNFAQDQQGNLIPRHPAVDGAAAAYFGAEMDSAMRRFHDLTMQGSQAANPEISDQAFRAIYAPRPSAPDKVAKADMTKSLRKMLDTDDTVAAAVYEQVLPYAQFYQDQGADAAMSLGLAAARAAGLEVWGNAVMKRHPGQPDLQEATGIPLQELGDVLQDTVTARIKDERFKGGRVTKWERLPGPRTVVRAWVYDDDHQPHLVNFSDTDLKAFWNKRQERKVREGASYQFGSQNTYRNPDDYPGIYASPDELRAWRERQQRK